MSKLYIRARTYSSIAGGMLAGDTPILQGYQIFHNYMRPHEALKGKTPADACGIEIVGDNKWLTVIQNASRHPTVNTSMNHPST